MDIYDFLRQFIALNPAAVIAVAAIVGGVAWGIIQGVDAVVRNRPGNNGVGLDPNIKYWGAILLCLVIPFFAWVVVNLNDHTPLTFGGVLLAGGVSFMAATTIHWIMGGSSKATAAHEDEKVIAAMNAATDTGVPTKPADDSGLA